MCFIGFNMTYNNFSSYTISLVLEKLTSVVNQYSVYTYFNPDSNMLSLANSEDLDEMQHNAAFHLGLHCLLRQNQSSEKYNIFGNYVP